MTDNDTAALLAHVREFFATYVVLPGDHFYDAVALWLLHAHAIEAAETTPRLISSSHRRRRPGRRGR